MTWIFWYLEDAEHDWCLPWFEKQKNKSRGETLREGDLVEKVLHIAWRTSRKAMRYQWTVLFCAQHAYGFILSTRILSGTHWITTSSFKTCLEVNRICLARRATRNTGTYKSDVQPFWKNTHSHAAHDFDFGTQGWTYPLLLEKRRNSVREGREEARERVYIE